MFDKELCGDLRLILITVFRTIWSFFDEIDLKADFLFRFCVKKHPKLLVKNIWNLLAKNIWNLLEKNIRNFLRKKNLSNLSVFVRIATIQTCFDGNWK